MGAELGWQKEIQRENGGKMQQEVTEGWEESEEGDGNMSSHLLSNSASILWQVSLQGVLLSSDQVLEVPYVQEQ